MTTPLYDTDILDTLKELINIGTGRAAAVLNGLLESHVDLYVAQIKLFPSAQFAEEFTFASEERLATVQMTFGGSFVGTVSLVFPTKSASDLVTVLMEDEVFYDEIDDMRAGTLTEIGNILINGVMGAISNILQEHLTYSVPIYMEDHPQVIWNTETVPLDSRAILAQTHFVVRRHDIQGDIFLVFAAQSFDIFMGSLGKLG